MLYKGRLWTVNAPRRVGRRLKATKVLQKCSAFFYLSDIVHRFGRMKILVTTLIMTMGIIISGLNGQSRSLVLKNNSGNVIDNLKIYDFPISYRFDNLILEKSGDFRLHNNRITFSINSVKPQSGEIPERFSVGLYEHDIISQRSKLIQKGATIKNVSFMVTSGIYYLSVKGERKGMDVYKFVVSDDESSVQIFKAL